MDFGQTGSAVLMKSDVSRKSEAKTKHEELHVPAGTHKAARYGTHANARRDATRSRIESTNLRECMMIYFDEAHFHNSRRQFVMMRKEGTKEKHKVLHGTTPCTPNEPYIQK